MRTERIYKNRARRRNKMGINFLAEHSKTITMRSLISTNAGKTLLAGIIILITGVLSKVYGCPYDSAILTAGGIVAMIGVLMFLGGSGKPDLGS